jgi:hypothetical protein
MKTEQAEEHVVAAAIRELAAAIRAAAPESPADPDALLTAEEVGGLRRRVSVQDVAQDFRAA